jgi:hypothetical protein
MEILAGKLRWFSILADSLAWLPMATESISTALSPSDAA